MLAHVTDLLLDALGVAHGVETEDARLSGARQQNAAEHAQRGGLAGAIRADESEDLAGGDFEGEAVDGEGLAETLRQPHELDGVHGCSAPAGASRISASAGIPGLSSPVGLGTSILTR